MSQETVTIEDRLRKFLRDRERLNRQLQAGEITPQVYAERHKEMREVLTSPMPLALIVENIEYNADCMKTSLFHSGMAKDHRTQLQRLETALRETIANLGGLLEDVQTLQSYEAPHILLELELHPCLKCIVFNQTEPNKRGESCEDCNDLEAREAYEAERPFYDGVEAGKG